MELMAIELGYLYEINAWLVISFFFHIMNIYGAIGELIELISSKHRELLGSLVMAWEEVFD